MPPQTIKSMSLMTKNHGVSNWHLNLLTTVKPSAPETKGILKNDGGKGGSGGGGDPGQPLKQGKTIVVSSGGYGASFLIKNEDPGKSADEGKVVLKISSRKIWSKLCASKVLVVALVLCCLVPLGSADTSNEVCHVALKPVVTVCSLVLCHGYPSDSLHTYCSLLLQFLSLFIKMALDDTNMGTLQDNAKNEEEDVYSIDGDLETSIEPAEVKMGPFFSHFCPAHYVASLL